MFSKFKCDNCGACCRLIVHAEDYDMMREPKLVELAAGNETLVLWDEEKKSCPFLDADNKCEIYPTRPVECVMLEPGDAKCQQARGMKGIDFLRDEDGNPPTMSQMVQSCSNYEMALTDIFTKKQIEVLDKFYPHYTRKGKATQYEPDVPPFQALVDKFKDDHPDVAEFEKTYLIPSAAPEQLLDLFYPKGDNGRRSWAGWAGFFEPCIPTRLMRIGLDLCQDALNGKNVRQFVAFLRCEHTKQLSRAGRGQEDVLCVPTNNALIAADILEGYKPDPKPDGVTMDGHAVDYKTRAASDKPQDAFETDLANLISQYLVYEPDGDVREKRIKIIKEAVTDRTPGPFQKALTGLINQYSIENEVDMPDFILAEMIVNIIKAAGPHIKQNTAWHGPGCEPLAACDPPADHETNGG